MFVAEPAEPAAGQPRARRFMNVCVCVCVMLVATKYGCGVLKDWVPHYPQLGSVYCRRNVCVYFKILQTTIMFTCTGSAQELRRDVKNIILMNIFNIQIKYFE